MPIDPELDAYHTRVAQAVPRTADPTPQARRARSEAIARQFPFPPDAVARSDHRVELPGRDIAVRIYRPGTGRLPAMLYLHGGGWVAGSIATHDGSCAALARGAGIVVASVDYRCAPEHPWPAPNDDAYAALEWLASHAAALEIDPGRLAVGGDSAGAHLAIGAALQAREEHGPPLALQLLIYPVIEPDFETPSYRQYAVSPTLTREDMIAFWNAYLPHPDMADARARPVSAPLDGLPPAHVVAAGLDPLHDEAVSFAARLRLAGVTTTLAEEPSLTHGFLRAAPYSSAAARALDAACRQVAVALGTAPAA
jgi:acetyl esterase